MSAHERVRGWLYWAIAVVFILAFFVLVSTAPSKPFETHKTKTTKSKVIKTKSGGAIYDSLDEQPRVFRKSRASWYGPGLFGNKTACGQTLTPRMVGVAHKTLPCGTMVTFHYGDESIDAPVIDRGPFVGGREWDLTAAAAQQLDFEGVGTVLSAS